MPDCLSPVVVHDQCFMKRMHVEVMELHDGVVIADCFSSDAAAPVALGVSVQCVFVTFLYTLPTVRPHEVVGDTRLFVACCGA
jgi:hypothetical protein